MSIQWRRDLPLLLNALGLTRHGAEVGVRAGSYSAILLCRWWGEHLYLVDSWGVYEDACPHQPSAEQQEEYLRQTERTLEPWLKEGTASIHRLDSLEGAKLFGDAQLDFAYIDAGHSFDEATADLAAWWPKVRAGGVIAGDDYGDDGEWYEVKRAVDTFFADRVGTLRVLPDETWIFIKGKEVE
jgi:hypothetical protein